MNFTREDIGLKVFDTSAGFCFIYDFLDRNTMLVSKGNMYILYDNYGRRDNSELHRTLFKTPLEASNYFKLLSRNDKKKYDIKLLEK